ncbi:MAG: two-component regulator propeller domain-containing protein [Nitriliruptoraceae bacterium]
MALGALLTACGGEQAWTTYTSDDGLASDAVASVTVGNDGTVWAGTHAGATSIAGERWTSHSPQDGPVGSLVVDVSVDGDDRVWAASTDGLATFDGERWEADGGAVSLPDWPASALTVAGDGRVLAGSDGLYRLEEDGQRWRRLPEGPDSVDYATLTVADDGTVWAAPDVVSGGQALFEYDGSDWTVHVTSEDPDADANPAGVLPGRLVRDVVVDADGTVWAGTDQGLASYDGEGWTHRGTEDGLPHAGVHALAIDRDGGIWVATLEEGVSEPDHAVSRFDGESWVTYTTDDGLPDGWVEDLAVGDDGSVWAATQSGLARYEH